ncbi:hypothetical protein QBC47DRAFT_392104 [Echria macrotheca]|uniref:DUF1445-domain-containing protein n=1 Tax=Echria macrotheca TaxID=438768 RepID=A0AAJ0F1B7_9PEZI|nr:hypothetical protein QBC47DRAFT_392104 [Echria macrotheca]
MANLSTGRAVRLAARTGSLTTQTAGLAPSHLQANLIVLPKPYAPSFRLLCQRNPVPCPLLAESSTPGSFSTLQSHLIRDGTPLPVARDIDLRLDAPKYLVYRDGTVSHETEDISSLWTDEHVGFLIGCSYSFEGALAEAGLMPRHVAQRRNVAMYRTTIPLCPAGVFTGSTYVVSMRPYRPEEVDRVREITRAFGETHGEPIAWGWDALEKLGIRDIGAPEWGEPARTADGTGVFGKESDEGYVPVFWGCGVTPQEAVMKAGLEGVVMGHKPGHMIVLDLRDHEVYRG